MTTAILALLAVLLAGPAPALVVRLERLRRTPRATLVLWQSLALAAVLAALGAGLSLATARPPLPVSVVALALTAVVAGRLLLSGHRVGTSLRSLRRRHREQIDLLAHMRSGVAVLDHDRALAYCLPGWTGRRVVVSTAALEALGEREVEAVLAHERAHLRARHDLVLEAFSVLHRAFPRWVSSAAALGEVRTLVEILADRSAAHAVGAGSVGRALVGLADSSVPDAALAAGGSAAGLVTRVELLGDTRPHPVQSALVTVAAVALLGLPTLLVVVPWLSGLAERW